MSTHSQDARIEAYNARIEEVFEQLISNTEASPKVTRSFCALPWLHLEVVPNGTAKICCAASESITQDGKPMSVYEYSVDEIWNSDYLKTIRQAMLDGESVSACTYCYRSEAESGSSIRTLYNAEWLDTLGDLDALRQKTLENNYVVNELPLYYQFSLGNLCNLSCRMCNAGYSDKIANDEVQRRWAPASHKPTLAEWHNDQLLIGPNTVVGVSYTGFHDISYHEGQYFAWTADKASVSIKIDPDTQIDKILIELNDLAQVETQFQVILNGMMVFQGCVESAPYRCEIVLDSALSSQEINLEILSDPSYRIPDSDNGYLGLPIEGIYLHRTQSKQKAVGQREKKFTQSRFSKDAPWFEQDSLIFGEFFSQQKAIKKLYFTGGEPTLHKSLEDIIDYLNDAGNPEDVVIQFNSNATFFNPRLLNKLKRFKLAKIALSVDSFGDHYEYIRFPAKWPTVAANIDKILELKHIHLLVSPAIQVLNLMTITQLMQFCDQRDIVCDTRNLVFYPEHLSIFILPENARKLATERLLSYSETLSQSKNQTTNRAIAKRLADYIFNLDSSVNLDVLKTFMLFTNDLDRKRNQDFKTTHSELFQLIIESGLNWTDETRFFIPSEHETKTVQLKFNPETETSGTTPSESDVLMQQIKLNQSKIEQLNNTISAMESSKFWKIRSQWLRLQKALGISRE